MGLPLDDVSSNFSSAFSTRLLRTAYAGPLIRLKDSVTTVETDFYQGATPGSLNTTSGGGGTDALTLYATSNGTVAKWYDQTGNGNHFSQSTVANQPQLVSSGAYVNTQNGHPCVKFASQFFTCVQAYTAPSNFTILAVCKATSNVAYMGIFKPDQPVTGWLLACESTGAQMGIERANAGVFKTSTFTINTAFLIDSSYDGSSTTLLLNGTSDANSWSDSGFGAQTASLGAGFQNLTSRAWAGWIAEVIVYSAALSTGDKATVRSDINSFWNVYSTGSPFAPRAPYTTGLASIKGIASRKW